MDIYIQEKRRHSSSASQNQPEYIIHTSSNILTPSLPRERTNKVLTTAHHLSQYNSLALDSASPVVRVPCIDPAHTVHGYTGPGSTALERTGPEQSWILSKLPSWTHAYLSGSSQALGWLAILGIQLVVEADSTSPVGSSPTWAKSAFEFLGHIDGEWVVRCR